MSIATVRLVGGKLFLIVVILLVKYSEILLVKYSEVLLVKYSEKACGTSSESKEGGRGLEFFLPRMALKLWNNSLHELLVGILKE